MTGCVSQAHLAASERRIGRGRNYQKRGCMTYPRDEIRVLVIDDHAMFAEAVARAVDVEPDLVLVGTALNLEDADRALAMHDIDAAILDIDVAGESGVELLRTWSRKLPDASFVVLVTEVRREVVLEVLEAGAAAVISKSRPAEDLMSAVRAARDGRLSVLLETAADQSDAIEPGLTDRELGIMRLLAEGRSDADIADILCISRNTVRTHIRRAFAKLGATSRLQAVAIARREHVI